jgi:hypothetical protein
LLKLRNPWATRTTFLTTRFTASVGPFGGPGGVVGEDLLAPALRGAGKATEFGDLGRLAVGDEGVEANGGFLDVGGRVEVAEGLLGQEGVEHLVSRIARGQAGLEPGPAGLAVALGGPQQ